MRITYDDEGMYIKANGNIGKILGLEDGYIFVKFEGKEVMTVKEEFMDDWFAFEITEKIVAGEYPKRMNDFCGDYDCYKMIEDIEEGEGYYFIVDKGQPSMEEKL